MKQLLFLLLFPCLCIAQYTGNAGQKITLGEQTTADGLMWRGRTSDTANLMTNKLDTSVYLVLDTMTKAMWLYRVTTTPKWNRVVDSLNNMQGQLSLTTKVTGTLAVANGGTGSNIGNITGSDSLHFQAGGSNKNVRITPATTGDIILNGDVSIGNRPAQERLSIGLNTNVEVGFGLESGGKGYFGTYSPPTYTYDGIVLSINRRPTNGVFANTNFSHAEIAVVAANSDSYIGFFTGQTNNVIGTERMRIIKNGDIGIGISSPTEKLHVVGNGRFTAVGAGAYANDLNITSTGVLTTASSDEKYKYNILPISYGLNTILQLKPVNFQWIEGEENDLGFIAQDVAEIIPEAVDTNWNSDLLMRYESIIPILTKAIQEQNLLIKALEQRILILENK